MVGNHDCYQYIGEGEKQEREDGRVYSGESQSFAHDSIEEDKSIKPEKHLHDSHDVNGTVDARQLDEQLVDEVGNEHENRQQRVSEDVVLRSRPFGDNRISPCIESRYVETIAKHLVVIVRKQGQCVLVMPNQQAIEKYDQQENAAGKESLFSLDG